MGTSILYINNFRKLLTKWGNKIVQQKNWLCNFFLDKIDLLICANTYEWFQIFF